MIEWRCLVCGAPMDKWCPFEKTVRKSEVCSDECYEIYMHNEDTGEIEYESDELIEKDKINENKT